MKLKLNESTRDNLVFAGKFTNIVVTLLIAFFGYLISSDVRDIQKSAEERAKAKEIQEFWSEMHDAADKIVDQSRRFGVALSEFTIASGQVMDEYDRIYRSGTLDSLNSDPKYLAAYASYLGSYGNVSSTVAAVGNEYAFLRVRYSAIAATHDITGWTSFTNQDEAISTWSTEAKAALDQVSRLINTILTERKDPNPFATALSSGFARLGSYLGSKPIPSALALSQFLDANWKAQTSSANVQ